MQNRMEKVEKLLKNASQEQMEWMLECLNSITEDALEIVEHYRYYNLLNDPNMGAASRIIENVYIIASKL